MLFRIHYSACSLFLFLDWLGLLFFFFSFSFGFYLVLTIQQALFGRDIWGRTVALTDEICQRRQTYRKRPENT